MGREWGGSGEEVRCMGGEGIYGYRGTKFVFFSLIDVCVFSIC